MTLSRDRRRKKKKYLQNHGTLVQLNRSTCDNCGEIGSHFAPPGFGSPGFYVCQRKDG